MNGVYLLLLLTPDVKVVCWKYISLQKNRFFIAVWYWIVWRWISIISSRIKKHCPSTVPHTCIVLTNSSRCRVCTVASESGAEWQETARLHAKSSWWSRWLTAASAVHQGCGYYILNLYAVADKEWAPARDCFCDHSKHWSFLRIVVAMAKQTLTQCSLVTQ